MGVGVGVIGAGVHEASEDAGGRNAKLAKPATVTPSTNTKAVAIQPPARERRLR